MWGSFEIDPATVELSDKTTALADTLMQACKKSWDTAKLWIPGSLDS